MLKSSNGEFYTLRNLASGQQQPGWPGQSSECLTAEADAPAHAKPSDEKSPATSMRNSRAEMSSRHCPRTPEPHKLHGTQNILYHAKLLNFCIICCISLYK